MEWTGSLPNSYLEALTLMWLYWESFWEIKFKWDHKGGVLIWEDWCHIIRGERAFSLHVHEEKGMWGYGQEVAIYKRKWLSQEPNHAHVLVLGFKPPRSIRQYISAIKKPVLWYFTTEAELTHTGGKDSFSETSPGPRLEENRKDFFVSMWVRFLLVWPYRVFLGKGNMR